MKEYPLLAFFLPTFRIAWEIPGLAVEVFVWTGMFTVSTSNALNASARVLAGNPSAS